MAKKKGNTNQETGNTVNMLVPNEWIVTVRPDGTRTVNTWGLNTVTELPSDYTEIVGKPWNRAEVTYPDMNSGLDEWITPEETTGWNKAEVTYPEDNGSTEPAWWTAWGTAGWTAWWTAGWTRWWANKGNPTPKSTGGQASNNDNWMLGHFDENGNYVDPYGVVFYDWFTGKNLNNADTEKSAYGDDSTLATYNTGNNKWGTNDKYTWENTRNTYTWYNANIKTSDLDPNYQYGWLAQQQESLENSYIANRNDNIASALYNEWKTSIEDVANFLNQQVWFQNSTPEQRENTINSVWKRIGQIKADEENKEEPKEETDLSKAEDIVQDTSGKIYGKTTAEEWNPKAWIDTLADANSVFRQMQESQVKNLQEFVSLNPEDIATCINNWFTTWSEQTWRDAQKYYPDFIASVNEAVKKQMTQQNVNAIASGEEINTVADKVDTNTQLTSYAVNNATSTTSATQLLKGIDSILESNNTAKSAQDLMWSIEKDMATLKNRLMNLKNEANAAFKWDAPQYLVSAYMNNKSQEIQNQLSILEDRYNAAYNRYKLEVSNAQWQAEFDLKKDSFALEKWKAENGWTTTSSTSSQSKMRTERNNNPTAMTTDYAKMMWLELWVDYEIWDSFIGGDGRTYYTAKFIWDPIEMSIKAFDRWAANNVFANEWWVLWHWHLWISNQQWLNMTDGEKREVINKILKKEWGSMNNMAYYQTNSSVSSWERTDYDYANFELFLSTDKENRLSKTDKEIMAAQYWTDVAWMTQLAINALADREGKAKEMWYDSSWELVADADWKGTAAYKIISADDGTPISFRQRIYNLVPATLKNSDVELKNLYNTAKILYEAGYSADEASMVFYWLDPRNDKTWLLRPLINLARTSWKKLDDTFYWRLWSLLESGNSKQAVLLVENSIMSDSQAEEEAKAVSTVDKIQQLEVLLQKAESLVWPIDNTLNKLITEWYWNEKYAYLAAQIDNIYWEVRNDLLWSNITGWEQDLYTWMFPNMSDKVSTIKQKLKATKNSLITNVNATRKRYDLPLLNQYTLVDYNLRAELYKQDEANI